MFHLAMPVLNIEESMDFYLNVLQAKLGRSASNWADFDLYGNQITLLEVNNFTKEIPVVGIEGNPVKHFGVILPLAQWHEVKNNLEQENIPFLSKPKIVFEGKIGEQHSFFIEDPNGYAIEFKGFENLDSVFQKFD